MSIESQIEREQQDLEDQLGRGEISVKEYNEMRETERDY